MEIIIYDNENDIYIFPNFNIEKKILFLRIYFFIQFTHLNDDIISDCIFHACIIQILLLFICLEIIIFI